MWWGGVIKIKVFFGTYYTTYTPFWLTTILTIYAFALLSNCWMDTVNSNPRMKLNAVLPSADILLYIWGEYPRRKCERKNEDEKQITFVVLWGSFISSFFWLSFKTFNKDFYDPYIHILFSLYFYFFFRLFLLSVVVISVFVSISLTFPIFLSIELSARIYTALMGCPCAVSCMAFVEICENYKSHQM